MFLISINFKNIIGFNSMDELMYTSWDRSYTEATSIGITAGHFIWGYYVSKLYIYSAYLPMYVSVLFFFYCFKHFYIKTNCSTLQIFLMLSQPSVLFFSLTYLRDSTLMAFMMILISLLCVTNRNKIWYIITFICLSLLLVLRPYVGIFAITCFILSTSKLSKFKLYRLFPILFISVGFIIYLNSNVMDLYKNLVIGYESISNFGLLGFDSSNLDNFKVALTFLLNWFYFWNTYTLFEIDSLFKMIFVYESSLMILFLLSIIIKFRKKIFILDRAYRFCLLIVLSSFVIGSFESGPATVLRHKLVLIPCLYYLFFKTYNVVFKSKNIEK
ncbi:hypothetical protein OA327_02115 [Flavobacteriales bacterium]|nr:hypothetical protein [Flavobacteriales bacterium]